GSGPENVGSFSVPTFSTSPLEKLIDDKNTEIHVGSVSTERVTSSLYPPKENLKKEKEEREKREEENIGKVPTQPTQPTSSPSEKREQSDIIDLQLEFRDLFQQVGKIVHQKLAPCGTLQWYVPDSNLETGQVTIKEYRYRLSILYASDDRHMIRAGL